MKRRIDRIEPVPWANPLPLARPRPLLTEKIWPTNPGGSEWARANRLLQLYYSDGREEPTDAAERFRSYLVCPDNYLVVWGAVGVGKTWFVRHQLGRTATDGLPLHAGVIDLLANADIERGIYQPLRYILEGYFARFFGSTDAALLFHAKQQLAGARAAHVESLSEGDEEECKQVVTRQLEAVLNDSAVQLVNYCRSLLEVLESLPNPEILVLGIDNADKTSDNEQESLVKLAARLLRHPKIRLVIPLRPSSRLLRDRFSVLNEFTYDEMALNQLDMRLMLRKRFDFAPDGRSLNSHPAVEDRLEPGRRYTFPKCFGLAFGAVAEAVPDSGQLILAMAAGNAREALRLTSRLMFSDQLKGLRNLASAERAVAALMLGNAGDGTGVSSALINLLDNEEPDKAGNALIRFRVMEYFWKMRLADTGEEGFWRHLDRLGYSSERIKGVLELFLMTQLLASKKGLSMNQLRERSLEKMGTLEITRAGDELARIATLQWYYVVAKLHCFLPPACIKVDERGVEYCSHGDFVRFLEHEEALERQRTMSFDQVNGAFTVPFLCERPSAIAQKALRGV